MEYGHAALPSAEAGIHLVDPHETIGDLFTLDCAFSQNDEVVAFDSPEELITFLTVDHDSSTYVINDETGKPAGYMAIVSDDAALEVLSIGVAPEAQGKGYGKEMMTRAESIAQNAGQAAIHLVTKVDNANAIAFYEKLGYEQTDIIANHYSNYDDTDPRVRMVKNLS
jgi:ribosomal protein S18 acetylase RimI-like enzyme